MGINKFNQSQIKLTSGLTKIKLTNRLKTLFNSNSNVFQPDRFDNVNSKNENKISDIDPFDDDFQNNMTANQINNNASQEIETLDLSSAMISEKFNESISELNNSSISDHYIDASFKASDYESQFNNYLQQYSSIREKAVAAAKFLSTKIPKLPYFWGGGHECDLSELKGINPKWGSLEKVTCPGDDEWKEGQEYPYSLDCSGYVSWCLINGGYKLEYCPNSNDFYKLGTPIKITDKNILENVKPGDLGWQDGHIGIVIDVNKEQKEVTFSHISGSGQGINITTISTETGLITKDDKGAMPSDKTNENRIGKEYFTDIISLDY